MSGGCATPSRVGHSMGSLPGLLSRHSTHDGKVNAESGWGRCRRSGICREALFFKGGGPYVGEAGAGLGRRRVDLVARGHALAIAYLNKLQALRRVILPDCKSN